MSKAKKSITMYRNLKKYGEQSLNREDAVKRFTEYIFKELKKTEPSNLEFQIMRFQGNIFKDTEESFEKKTLYYLGVEGTQRLGLTDNLQIALRFTNGYEDIIIYEDYSNMQKYEENTIYEVSYRYTLKADSFVEYKKAVHDALRENKIAYIQQYVSSEEPEIIVMNKVEKALASK